VEAMTSIALIYERMMFLGLVWFFVCFSCVWLQLVLVMWQGWWMAIISNKSLKN
jgi:hypothetical protein